MGLLKRLLESRDGATLKYPPTWLIEALRGGATTTAGVTVTPERSLQYTAVLSATRVLAESLAGLPCIIYRRLERGKERAKDHWLYPLLHNAPHPRMTAFEFFEIGMVHLALWGNFYAQVIRDGAGRVREMWPLRPDRMEINVFGSELEYVYTPPDGGRLIIPRENLLHVRGMGSDGIRGYSLITLARQSIALGMAAEEFGARFFANDARPGVILQHPGVLSDEARRRLREEWNARHAGLSGAHQTAVLEEGMTVTTVGVPPEDAQFLETRRFQVNEIARIFRIPPHMLGDLERATFCLPASAEIYTIHGPKRIVDVKPGDIVWSRQEGGGLVLASVEHSGPSGEDTILRIATTNRVIRLNAKHRVLARRRKERPLQPGEIGGRNRNGQKFRVEWVTEYVPAGELRVGDVIVVFDGTPDSGIWRTPTRTATVGFMEFCGLYLGDGYMTDGHVTIARAKDAPYMDHYREVMRQEFTRFDGGNGRGDKSNVPRAPVTLIEGERYTRFASVEAVAELRALGLGGTAHEKRVPGWVFQMADEAKLAFLRGYLDADGSVDKQGRIAFSSCNRELLSGIRHLCMSLGIPVTNVVERIGYTRAPNGRVTPVHQYAFTCSDPGSNLRIGSHDPRYIARLRSGKPFAHNERSYPRHGGCSFSEPGARLSRIVSITVENPEPVYDLTVSGTHSFIADGVVVHNSNVEQQAIDFAVHTMRPWCRRWEQALELQLLRPAERSLYLIEFLMDGLLRGDIESRYRAYAIGRQWGWLSANDVRERENMNPIDGGDRYLEPLNMQPSGQAPQEQERVAGLAPERRAWEQVEDRRRIMVSYIPVLQDTFQRIINREANDVRNNARRIWGKRDREEWRRWLDQFYQEHQEFVERYLTASFRTYSDLIISAALKEIGESPETVPRTKVEQFVMDYIRAAARRHVGFSKGELLALPDEGMPDALDQVLDEWTTHRPMQAAEEESHRAGNAFAKIAWMAAGVQYLVWRASPTACEWCSYMDGRVVGIDGSFLPEGGQIALEGKEPFAVQRAVGHPPLHRGCKCVIAVA